MFKYVMILILNVQGMPAAVTLGEYTDWRDCMNAGLVVYEEMGDEAVHDIKCVKVPQ